VEKNQNRSGLIIYQDDYVTNRLYDDQNKMLFIQEVKRTVVSRIVFQKLKHSRAELNLKKIVSYSIKSESDSVYLPKQQTLQALTVKQ